MADGGDIIALLDVIAVEDRIGNQKRIDEGKAVVDIRIRRRIEQRGIDDVMVTDRVAEPQSGRRKGRIDRIGIGQRRRA
jgi:hypothetical protein